MSKIRRYHYFDGRARLAMVSLVVALSCFLFLSIFPHHHHGNEVCLQIEVCEEDGSLNDKHTHHSEDEIPDENDCFLSNPDFIVPHFHHHHSQNIIPFVAYLNEYEGFIEEYQFCKHYPTDRKSPLEWVYVAPNLLRGPPSLL